MKHLKLVKLFGLRYRRLIYVVVAILTSLGILISLLSYVPSLSVQQRGLEEQNINKIDTWLQRLATTNRFNGQIMITKDGTPLLLKAYGKSEPGKQMALNTCLDIASVSKQFTAVAALQLAEKGFIDLDRPILQYVKGFPYDSVTTRQLLNHTSGIPDTYMTESKQHKKEFGPALSSGEVMQMTIDNPVKLDSRPGTVFSYSNTGYVLAAAIIERISGVSYETYATENIFKPLGMEDTRVWTLDSGYPLPNNCSQGYTKIGPYQKLTERNWIDGVAGDGSVFTTAEDMVRWEQAWRGMSPNVISDSMRIKAVAVPELRKEPSVAYGLGWVVQDKVTWHDGQWLSNNSVYVRANNGVSLFMVDGSSNHLRFHTISGEVGKALGIKD